MDAQRILYIKIAIGAIITVALISIGLSIYSGDTTQGANSTSSKSMKSEAVVTDDSIDINIGGNSNGNFDFSRKTGIPIETTPESEATSDPEVEILTEEEVEVFMEK